MATWAVLFLGLRLLTGAGSWGAVSTGTRPPELAASALVAG